MASRFDRARAEFRSTLTSQQQRGVAVLGWISVVIIVGLVFTGLWQFFTHESSPSWFAHVPGSDSRPRAAPSEGAADLHSVLGAAAGVVALLGGAWYAYKVAFDVPRFAVLALCLAIFGLVTGSLIRFNAVKLRGLQYEDANRGYGQLFVNEVEYVVTDKWDLGSTAIRLWTVSHLLTIPVLLGFVWFGLARAAALDPDRSALT